VCVNKTCKRQGSVQIAQLASDFAVPGVVATTCGCLGNCGAGPNVTVIPVGTNKESTPPMLLHHISTPAKLASMLSAVCGANIDGNVLRMTELRVAGNAAAHAGDVERAIELYTEALDFNHTTGVHLLLSNRSAARLASGDALGAVEDASRAVECCPDDFVVAAIRLADSLFALQRFSESLEALEAGARRNPSWGKSKEYRDLFREVDKAVPKVNR